MLKPDFVPGHCVDLNSNRKIKVEARGRRAVFSNPEREAIAVINVDCWLRSPEGIKADHILMKSPTATVVVELKGSNVQHAIRQIQATAELWRAKSMNESMMGGLVICSNSPESSARLANIKLKLLAKSRILLAVDKTGKKEYDFYDFVGRRS